MVRKLKLGLGITSEIYWSSRITEMVGEGTILEGRKNEDCLPLTITLSTTENSLRNSSEASDIQEIISFYN